MLSLTLVKLTLFYPLFQVSNRGQCKSGIFCTEPFLCVAFRARMAPSSKPKVRTGIPIPFLIAVANIAEKKFQTPSFHTSSSRRASEAGRPRHARFVFRPRRVSTSNIRQTPTFVQTELRRVLFRAGILRIRESSLARRYGRQEFWFVSRQCLWQRWEKEMAFPTDLGIWRKDFISYTNNQNQYLCLWVLEINDSAQLYGGKCVWSWGGEGCNWIFQRNWTWQFPALILSSSSDGLWSSWCTSGGGMRG